jgi:hypothetical protein
LCLSILIRVFSNLIMLNNKKYVEHVFSCVSIDFSSSVIYFDEYKKLRPILINLVRTRAKRRTSCKGSRVQSKMNAGLSGMLQLAEKIPEY